MPARTFAVIPAAGLSRRMGQPKLLIDLAGQTVIARLLTSLQEAGVDEIVVIGRKSDEALWSEVGKSLAHPIKPFVDPRDMRLSIEYGLSYIESKREPTDDDCWLLIPADHPVLDPSVVRDVINEWRKTPTKVVIPTYEGQRGHPTAVPWRIVPEIFEMPPSKGMNWLLRSQPALVREWPTSNAAVVVDLDTPEDLARLQAEYNFNAPAHLPETSRELLCVATADSTEAPANTAIKNESVPLSKIGGVVVCGGKSTRMGQPKLSLPFGPELMLQRVCRILSEVVAPIVVVAAEEQEVPPLPSNVRVVRDEYPEQGPLAGIATGLAALRGQADAAYVTSCDVPLLKPDFVRSLIARLDAHSAVVPSDAEHVHVLAGVYRIELEALARQLLSEQRRRPLFLIEQAHALRVPTSELCAVDKELDSLKNLNTPADYEAALCKYEL